MKENSNELNLYDWLNPLYVDEYFSGDLASRRVDSPFKYTVIENLLNEEKFKEILDYIETIPTEQSGKEGIPGDADWFWGAFGHIQFVKFLHSPAFKNFLSSLMAEPIISKTESMPQFNKFMPYSKGLPVHTDNHNTVGVVTLLYLTSPCSNIEGGELVFYKKKHDKVREFKRIPPKSNTYVAFRANEHSYHSVNDMKGAWERKNLAIDWYTDVSQKKSATKQAVDKYL